MLGLVTGSSGSTMDDNVWEQAECLVPLPGLPLGLIVASEVMAFGNK